MKGRHKFSQTSSSVGLCHPSPELLSYFFSLEHTYLASSSLIDCVLSILTVSPSNYHTLVVFDFSTESIASRAKQKEWSGAERNWFCRAKRAKKRTRKTVRQNDCALFKRFIYSDVKVHVRHHEPQWMCFVSGFSVYNSILFIHAILGIDCFASHPFDTYTFFFVTQLLYLCEWRRAYFCGDTINS